MMGGLFGLSDELWSLVVQVFGIGLALIIGARCGNRPLPLATLVTLALAVDVVAQLVIAGEGPGFFVGLIMFPIYFVVAAWIARAIALAVNRKMNRI